MLKRLGDILFGNFIIKLFSVIFAVALWLHVMTHGTTELSLSVPLELRDIPASMAVVGDVPRYVDVRLSGREAFMGRLSPRDVKAYISLAQSKQGEAVYTLAPGDVKVPAGVAVNSVTPSEVRLRTERLVRRRVPVKPSIIGRPAAGYRVAGASADPPEAGVEGTANALREVQTISTDDIDVGGLTGDAVRDAGLVQPSEGGVKLLDDGVKVNVTIARDRGGKVQR